MYNSAVWSRKLCLQGGPKSEPYLFHCYSVNNNKHARKLWFYWYFE